MNFRKRLQYEQSRKCQNPRRRGRLLSSTSRAIQKWRKNDVPRAIKNNVNKTKKFITFFRIIRASRYDSQPSHGEYIISNSTLSTFANFFTFHQPPSYLRECHSVKVRESHFS